MTITLTVQMRNHLRDFLKHIFNAGDGEIVLNRHNDIGKRLYALIDKSDYPVKRQRTESDVTIHLSETEHSKANAGFYFLSKENEVKWVNFVESEFNIICKLFFMKGYYFHLPQKEIVNYFLEVYEIEPNSISADAIKKNDYRNRVRYDGIFKKLLQSVEL